MPFTTFFWLRRALRGTVAWSVGVAVMVAVVTAAYLAEAGTPQEAARFGASLEPFALSVRPLMGEPVALETAGGFLHWRVLLALPLGISAYLIVLVTRLSVREERRGAADLVLSTPLDRGRFMAERVAAVTVVCLVIGVAGLVLGGWGARALGAAFSPAALFWAGLNLGLLLLVWSMSALLVSQFTLSRAAAGAVTALLMVTVHLIANVGTTVDSLQGVLRFLPTGAYASSRPLVPSVGADAWGMVILAAQAFFLASAATASFLGRDLNVARRWTRGRRVGDTAEAAENRGRRLTPLLVRGPFSRDLWALRGVTLGWTVGLAALMAFIVAVEPTLRAPMEELLENFGPLAQVFAADLLAPGALVGLMFGLFLAPALSVFAVLQAGRFAGELEDGLMVLDLSTPLGRRRLLVSRAAAVVLAAGLALAGCWLTAMVVSQLAGVPVSAATLARAAVAALPVVLVYVSVGMVVTSWIRPGWAAAFAGALALTDFVYGLVASILDLPDWAAGISVFGRYGNPALEGLRFSSHGVLLLAGLALLALAAEGFRRRDLSW